MKMMKMGWTATVVIVVLIMVAAGMSSTAAAESSFDDFVPCETSGTFTCKAHSVFHLGNDLVAAGGWAAKAEIIQESNLTHSFIFQIAGTVNSGHCVYRIWSDPDEPEADCNDNANGSHTHQKWIDGCDRYIGTTVDPEHEQGEYVHTTSYECVRDGTFDGEPVFETFDSFGPVCGGDIEGEYTCKAIATRAYDEGSKEIRSSNTFTRTIRAYDSNSFEEGIAVVSSDTPDVEELLDDAYQNVALSDPALCSFMLPYEEEDDVDDYIARARCADYTDASEKELRFYNNCKSYVVVNREAKTEHPDEGEDDYYGVPLVSLQECHRQEDAAMDADFPFLDKPGIDADSCDIAGVWECQGVQQSGDVDGSVSTEFGVGNVTIYDVSEHTFSASNASPMSTSICKTEPWSEPSAPTASCVQTKLSGHSYLHFNDGCSQLTLTSITSVVEPKDASRDPYFEDPVVRAAECTKIE